MRNVVSFVERKRKSDDDVDKVLPRQSPDININIKLLDDYNFFFSSFDETTTNNQLDLRLDFFLKHFAVNNEEQQQQTQEAQQK